LGANYTQQTDADCAWHSYALCKIFFVSLYYTSYQLVAAVKNKTRINLVVITVHSKPYKFLEKGCLHFCYRTC